MWKCGDTWSRLVLIERGLNLTTIYLVLKEKSGDDGKVDTPVPIPNTEVKHFIADGSTIVRE